jgi:uncharacterized protein (TIGR00369 family)
MAAEVEIRIRESYARQRAMHAIGAALQTISPGEVTICLPFSPELTQQHGFFHAGIVTMIVDTACGYAALTTMPPGAAVLTVEYKVNFLSPAMGQTLVARGQVLKAGKTLVTCYGEVLAENEGLEKRVAVMTATMIVREGTGLSG